MHDCPCPGCIDVVYSDEPREMCESCCAGLHSAHDDDEMMGG